MGVYTQSIRKKRKSHETITISPEDKPPRGCVFFIVQIGTLLVSEFFSQMYNPSRNVDFGGRVLLALNPKLLVFVLVICTGTGFLIRAYLKPSEGA